MFGTYIELHARDLYTVIPVKRSTKAAIGAICYNFLGSISNRKQTTVAVECELNNKDNYQPNFKWPMAISRTPTGSPNHEWYYSVAKLSNVKTVQVCVDTTISHQQCLGICLSYLDLTYSVILGQWRSDRTISPPTDFPISIGWVSNGFGRKQYIKNITFDSHGKSNQIPMRERLEWWFTTTQAVIVHHDD